MNTVRITAIRQTVYPDLIAQYENSIEHAYRLTSKGLDLFSQLTGDTPKSQE